MADESVPPADIVVCSHYCPVCVLPSCERGGEGHRERHDNAELVGVKIQQKVEHEGMKKGGEMSESGWKTAVGPPMRDTQHDNGDTDEKTADTD